MRELRLAIRSLAASPVFALSAILCIALGVGANAAVFSVVDAVLLRPLPLRDLDRMVVVREDLTKLGLEDARLDPPTVMDVAARRDLFDGAAAFARTSYNLTRDDGEPSRIGAARTLGGWFSLMGARAAVGRLYAPEASREEARVVVLGHAFWRERFGGDPAVVGTSIRLDGNPYEVVGVAGPELRYPRTADVFVPYPQDSTFARERGRLVMTMIARLRDGVGPERLVAGLRQEAMRVADEGARIGRAEDLGLVLHASPLVGFLAGELRPVTLALSGAVALVLLIAAANVACLQLVRATGRARELAVRAALGARGSALARTLAAESVAIAAIGGALGVAVGLAAVAALRRWGPERFPMLRDAQLDARVLLFALAVTALATLLAGLAPAVRAAKADPQDALRGAGRGTSMGKARHRFLHGAVVTQMALALALVLGSGLLVRSLSRLVATDPGFRADGVVTARFALPRATYDSPEKVRAFHDALLDRLRTAPGVQGAAVVAFLPFGGGSDSSPFSVTGRDVPPGGEQPHANYNVVSDDYFRAMGVRVVRGRGFLPSDARGAPAVAVVDEELARAHFPGENPIGKRIRQMGDLEIVGVVANVAQVTLGEEPHPTIYYPLRQRGTGGASIVLRATLPPASAVRLVRAAVADLDARLPVHDVRAMRERVVESLGARRLAVSVLAGFAGVALALAVLGIYGVLSYGVTQRMRELGIRSALGAQSHEVVGLVLGRGLRLTLLGLAAGTLLFLALGRGLSALLYGVGPRDPLTLVAGGALLGSIAMLASWLPARRAARVQPISVLRGE